MGRHDPLAEDLLPAYIRIIPHITECPLDIADHRWCGNHADTAYIRMDCFWKQYAFGNPITHCGAVGGGGFQRSPLVDRHTMLEAVRIYGVACRHGEL